MDNSIMEMSPICARNRRWKRHPSVSYERSGSLTKQVHPDGRLLGEGAGRRHEKPRVPHPTMILQDPPPRQATEDNLSSITWGRTPGSGPKGNLLCDAASAERPSSPGIQVNHPPKVHSSPEATPITAWRQWHHPGLTHTGADHVRSLQADVTIREIAYCSVITVANE